MCECSADKPRRNAATFECAGDLGMKDSHHIAFEPIVGARHLSVDNRFKALCRLVMANVDRMRQANTGATISKPMQMPVRKLAQRVIQPLYRVIAGSGLVQTEEL